MSLTPFPLLSCLLPAPAPASARSVFGLRPHELHDKDRRLSWGREERAKAAKSKSTPLTGSRGLDQHWAGKRQGRDRGISAFGTVWRCPNAARR